MCFGIPDEGWADIAHGRGLRARELLVLAFLCQHLGKLGQGAGVDLHILTL